MENYILFSDVSIILSYAEFKASLLLLPTGIKELPFFQIGSMLDLL